MVCQVEETRDWLAVMIPALVASECSRFKMVNLDVLPTYKKVMVWFPCPVEDTERHSQRIRRLNQGLDTRK